VTPDGAYRYDLAVAALGGTVLDAGDLGLAEPPGAGFTDCGLYKGKPVHDGTAVPNSTEALHPLIESVIAYVNDPANSVENLVVTGHSLAARWPGGSTGRR